MNKPSRRQIAKASVELLNKGVSEPKLAKQLAAYLLSERRTAELAPLMRDIADLRAHQGVVEVTAVSTHKLEASTEASIKKLAAKPYPNAKKVILNHEQDSSLVSGLLFKSGDYELDLSAHGKLNQLKLTRSES